jgi:hypothetical protein
MSEVLIATVVVLLTVLFGSIIIHENLNKPKYEIKYLRGWWVIRDIKTKTHMRRFRSQEQAEIWFNENCI